jgi:hypothetical protein
VAIALALMKMLFKTRLCIAIAAAAAAAAAVVAAAAAAVVGSGTYSGMLSHEAVEEARSFNLAVERAAVMAASSVITGIMVMMMRRQSCNHSWRLRLKGWCRDHGRTMTAMKMRFAYHSSLSMMTTSAMAALTVTLHTWGMQRMGV